MLASVIVSTYNRPEHLERCLESLRYQTTQDFEILIADDGSGPETRAVVERAVRELPVDVTHAFQEDRGFRKSAILNRAAQMARSDYLIYTDGDCLLRENFVETHIHYRRPGEFLVGRPVKLSRKRSEQIDFATIQKGRHARPALSDWWDMLWRRNRYLPYGVYLPGRVGFEIAQRLKKNKSPRGTNMSLWKSDLMRVNGWNEDFEGWGLEDVELGYRLRLGGVVPKLVVYKAIAFHLWHAEEDKTSKRPRHAYTATKQRGLAWCPNGLVKAATPEEAGQIA